MSDPSKSIPHEAAEVGREVIRKASPLAVGIAVVLVVFFTGLGGIFFVNRETIIKLFETAKEVEHLHADHDHCQAELTEVKARVAEHEREIRALKSKQTASIQ